MGKPHTSTIQLNGKVYDIKASHRTHPHSTQVKSQQPTAEPHKPTVKSIPVKDTVSVKSETRHPTDTVHAVAPKANKKVQRSKTLMRSAVKKPVATKKNPYTPLYKPVVIDPERVKRAHSAHKSNLISRFGPKHQSSIAPQIVPLAVQAEPSVPEHTAVLNDHFESAVVSIPRGHKVSHTNPFETAIAHANSHNQPKPKKVTKTNRLAHRLHLKPKTVRAAAVMILLLGVGGFFVHQNVPKFAMELAGKRAGVNAHLPSYQPSGFSLNGAIQYQSGQVAASYKSNSDDRTFKITQRNTDLSNASLQPTQVLGANTSYQTVQYNGKTIYITDNNKATWVEDGILYEIEGQDLSNDQVLRLASSL